MHTEGMSCGEKSGKSCSSGELHGQRMLKVAKGMCFTW